jgi:predicted flap endonuclease-1-like 5' DNA nuclease
MEFKILLLASLEPCWLWWLILSALAFILGALIGCWLCGNRKRIRELEEENAGLKARLTNWEKDYSSLKYQQEEVEKEMKNLRQKLTSCEADKTVLQTKMDQLKAQTGDGNSNLFASAMPVAGGDGSNIDFASIFSSDNLQIIEGIGPKIEAVLKAGGISRWADVAASGEEKLRKILTDQNPNYRIHNPQSWPEQARLANEGKWEELIQYQKFLDGGKEGTGSMESDSKVEKLSLKILGFSSNPEDLKIIEGIGPKIEQLLKEAGINNWQALADAEVARLREILAAAGDQFKLAQPDTWPKQAALAAAGQWSQLNELQDRLQGGIDKG